jgi:hypothetical protein
MLASPSTSLFEHILFVRAVLWLTDFTGWTSTACQQTGPSTQSLVPPAMFDPHAIRHFSGTYAEARRKFLDAAAGQGASIES